MNNQKYQHWQLAEDKQAILWLSFDRQDASVNTLNTEVMRELDAILDEVASNKKLKGLIIQSAKKTAFIAGADIKQFVAIKTKSEALQLIETGQKVFNKLEALKLPTLALIAGHCLGGGLELALACRYRIAEEGTSLRIGLPEVKLGIQPGWGGSVRLPALIGAPAALDLMLAGRAVDARKAKKLGIIDDAVPVRYLRTAAITQILSSPKLRQPKGWLKFSNHQLIRPLIANMAGKKLAKKVSEAHYPAPYTLLRNWQQHGTSKKKGLKAEAKSVAELLMSDTSKNLVRIFNLQEGVKRLGKSVDFDVKHVHVIGAGVMGGDIAAWCALSGLTVSLQDREAKFVAPAIKRAYSLFKKRLKSKRLVREAMDRLHPDVAGASLARADIVIEAIYENLEAKQKLFKHLEETLEKDVLLATNTSSIPLKEIASVLENPNRLVGIHFFNPVAMMPLVEVIKEGTSEEQVVQNALAFVRRINRLPILVKSHPGFLVNRILMPYLMESFLLLEEGFSPSVVDAAAIEFGMPMGPIELADKVGLDVCFSVAKHLSAAFNTEIPVHLTKMVESGKLGCKTGEGFYEYEKGKPVKAKNLATNNQKTLQQRLILRMVNESVACLREGIIMDADVLDLSMIFGTGFAPFRGGPLQYAREAGSDKLLAELNKLHKKLGERFRPDAGWQDVFK